MTVAFIQVSNTKNTKEPTLIDYRINIVGLLSSFCKGLRPGQGIIQFENPRKTKNQRVANGYPRILFQFCEFESRGVQIYLIKMFKA